MMSKRTIIGLIVGSIIIAIGLYALVTSFGLQQVKDTEIFEPGETTSYDFDAPIHAKQNMNITGNSDLTVDYVLEVLTDPIQITYHIIVIIGGVVILGFSAGFSIRKPKGF